MTRQPSVPGTIGCGNQWRVMGQAITLVSLVILGCWALPGLFTNHAYAGELKSYAGAAKPDFTLTDLQGESHTLSAYQGQVVLVNFWATWCPPCVREMPSMQRLQEQLDDRPFSILAVNQGEDERVIRAYLERQPLSFTILRDPDGEISAGWQLKGIPTSYLFDKSGRVRYLLQGSIEWDEIATLETVRKLLEE